MKKYLNWFIFLTVGFLLVIGFSFIRPMDKKIDNILKSKAYSYLPVEAKDYVKEVYEKTGQLILTEKNKNDNTPYLNPEYASYLSLDESKQEEINLIPNIYVVDFAPSDDYKENNYPSYYNLSNINGESYTTPFKNQLNTQLCWSFSSIEQVESYLMVKNNKPYTSESEKFSVRQMDYATSIDGINNYTNENGYRYLTTGGNYFMSSLIMANGLTLANDSYMPFNTSSNKNELADVLNYNLSNYEVNSTVMMPYLGSSATTETIETYKNILKENIIKNGGAYLGTGSPNYDCGFKNTDNTYAIADRDNCVGNSGHAMQIIGWDDNYDYSYCVSGFTHYDANSNGTCTRGTLVTGKGAWLVRNSWGSDTDYKYVYLTYNSYGMDVDFVTSLSSMNDRTWDNNYHKNIWQDGATDMKNDSIVFNKNINTQEKVEQVKFLAYSSNGNYSISIQTENNTYNNIKTFTVKYPGIYTIDLSNSNIILDGSQFKVTISTNNNTYLVSNTISVFTSNILNAPVIKTNSLSANDFVKNSDENFNVLTYSSTKNIDSDENVSYALYNKDTNVSDYIVNTSNTRVAENNVNATLTIDKNIPTGNYILKTTYGDYTFDSNFKIVSSHALIGSGTEVDPYLIYNESDLNQIRYNLDAYYLLKNDITLEENWIPLGTSIRPFSGGFDGGNHTINGLVIDEQSEESVGFFGYVKVKFPYTIRDNATGLVNNITETTYIKNVRFNNALVSNTGNAGILVGQVMINANDTLSGAYNIYSPSLVIDSVHFIGGSVLSSVEDAGVIIGKIDIIPKGSNTPYITINNTFSSAKISGYHSAGLIGFINDSYISGSSIMLDLKMKNFQNVGKIDETIFDIEYSRYNYYSPVIGGVYGNIKLTADNFIINSIINDTAYMLDFTTRDYLIGSYDISSDSLSYTKGNGYYVSSFEGTRYYTSASSIKDSSLYTSWTDFSKYFKMETVNSVTRIPVLKDITYDYTSIDDIDMKLYDNVSLLDCINGASDINYIDYTVVSNDNVINIERTNPVNDYYTDINIKALKKGTAVIHVINSYDGYERDVSINVTADKVAKPTITYYSSKYSNAETYTQQVNALQSFKLNKNQFTKKGYKIKSWNTLPNGQGVSYRDQQLFTDGIDEDLELYIEWEERDYEVRYDANGGIGSMPGRITSISSPITLNSNAYTKEGYTFTGWNTKADGTGYSLADKDMLFIQNLPDDFKYGMIVLYAQWLPINSTIKFDSNGGTGNMDDITVTTNTSKTLSDNTFTKEGYTFTGWNTKSDGTGTSYTDGQTITVTNHITLYAQWTLLTSIIKFNSNGGTGNMNDMVVGYNTSNIITTNTFTKVGYDFNGWNTKIDGTGTSYTDGQNISITSDVTLYAQWKIKKFNVTFYSNNGTSNKSTQVIEYNVATNLLENAFTKEEYTFVGWNTKTDGTGTKYLDKQLVTITSDLELYAMWEEQFKYITTYTEDDNLNIFDGIKIGTSIDNYKSNFILNTNYRIEILTSYNVINTGSITRIYHNSDLFKEYVNVVRGDVNGDGKVTSGDYIKIKKHIMNTEVISNNAIFKSADANKDSKITSGDYIKIKKFIMNGDGL